MIDIWILVFVLVILILGTSEILIRDEENDDAD